LSDFISSGDAFPNDERGPLRENENELQTPKVAKRWSLGKAFSWIGPGLVTGASDDDPSGIATYSQAGAQYGFGLLWLMVFSYPLMCAIQEICARIGRVTGRGISANLLRNYPRPIVGGIVLSLLISSIFNLGADLGAMGEATHMLIGGPRWVHILFFGVASLLLQVFVRYTRYVNYLKWLAISLFAYVATVFIVHVPWANVLRQTFLPTTISLHGDYVKMAVAVLGTTISPYLFFWQSSQEAEETKDRCNEKPLLKAPEQAPEQLWRIKLDTYAGMAASNVVAFFIMLTTAVTLHAHGDTNIETAAQAAKALEPLAGRYAYVLFSLGIIGTGLLAVPVLAGASAFAAGEAMRWRVGLEVKPKKATKFYIALGAAMLLGLSLDFLKMDPIKALVISAVINGLLAFPVMVMTMLMTQNRKIMGEFALPGYLRIFGWMATLVMGAASLVFLIQSI
jgi:NRAMP (natural resistance-associated macrophage protein)-like metal ion transporter